MHAAKMLEKEIGKSLKPEHSLPQTIGENGLLASSGSKLKERNKAVTAAMDDRDAETISTFSSLAELIRRMEDFSDINARRIITTHPNAFNMDTELNDRVFCNIVLQELGLHIKSDPPKTCVCGRAYTPAHPHGCVKLRRKAVTARHNSLAATLAQILIEAGFVVTIEPQTGVDFDPSKKKPDLLVESASGRSFSIDTTVIHTTSESYVKTGVASQMNTRAKLKKTKYTARESSANRDFFPFVVTSFGSFHSEALNLLKRIGDHAVKRKLTWNSDMFVKKAIRRLLYSLHLGNSAVLEYAWNQKFEVDQAAV